MIVTVVATATTAVGIVNAGDTDCPAATTTVVGGTAAGSLLVSCTVAPPAGANPTNFTVFPVAATLPTTDVGPTVNADKVAGFTVSTDILLCPL